MKLAIMQPYFFPYLGYFQLMAAVDRFVIYDDVNFIKQGWINRNRILVNGQAKFITIPVKKISSFRSIANTEIDRSKPWSDKMLKTIEQSYCKSPHFEEVYAGIVSVIQSEPRTIGELATNSIAFVKDHLKIETTLISSSIAYGNSNLSGQNRVLDICKKEGADTYINPLGGRTLYNHDHFNVNDLNLRFIQPHIQPYSQGKHDAFISHLSIIDVLMFNSVEQVRDMLNDHTIVQ